MNYKDYTLGDWIGHISGIIEDETTLDGNEMRDLVEFLTTIREPKTNGDCISRQAAKRALEDRFMELQKRHDDKRYETNYCLNTILELPPVNPIEPQTDILLNQHDSELNRVKDELEPKTGHWIIIDDCELFMAKCSECGEIVDSRMIHKYPYCHCGAKMESEGKE